jgi:hypothetical protein
MPIKGVSEVVRLPRLGKIRLGTKREASSGSWYPSPTDYFVCPEEVRKAYGDRPKELRVMFPTEDETQWASQYLKCYSASRGLVCRGDGETAIARVDVSTGEVASRGSGETELREISCNPASCPFYGKGQCRRVMNLQFLLPECPGFGVYQLDTTSYHSIVNINSAIKLVRGICGRISMLPLSLRLVEYQVQPQGTRKTVHVLSLSAPYSLVEIQRYAQLPPGQVLLPAPDSEAPDDLFPDEVLGAASTTEGAADEIPAIDEQLLVLWETARRKIAELDIKEAQLARWFEEHYRLEAGLADFQMAVPPEKFTTEQLSRLIDSLALYAGRLKGKKLP